MSGTVIARLSTGNTLNFSVAYNFRSLSTTASMTFGNISMAYAPSASAATGTKAYQFDTLSGNSITLNGNLGGPVAGTQNNLTIGNNGGAAGANYFVNGDNSALSSTGTILRGNVFLGSANALGGTGRTTNIGIGTATADAASVLTNAAVTVVSNFTVGAQAASLASLSIGGNTAETSGFSGTVGMNNRGLNYTAVANGRVNFSGQISGTNATLSTVNKTGAGIVAFSGSNTYLAGTTVSKGTLLINNTAGTGTGIGAVAVASGATLGGTGAIAMTGANGVSVSGILAPGETSSIGTFTISLGNTTGNVTMLTGSTFAFDITGGTPNLSDRINLLGTAVASDFVFNNNVINFTLSGGLVVNQTYLLIDGTADNQFTGLTLSGNEITSGLSFSGLSGGFQTSSTLTLVNGDIIFTAIPEPSTTLLIVIGLTAFIIMSRRGWQRGCSKQRYSFLKEVGTSRRRQLRRLSHYP